MEKDIRKKFKEWNSLSTIKIYVQKKKNETDIGNVKRMTDSKAESGIKGRTDSWGIKSVVY